VPEQHEKDSIFDFLFHDGRRIAAFLAQFHDYGHLQNIKSREGISKDVKRGFSLKAGFSLPNFSGIPTADTGGGDITFSRDPLDSGSITSEKNFDPYWANARNFLDIIDEKGLLSREIEKARIGQLVLFSGNIIIVDTRFTTSLGKSPAAVQQIALATSLLSNEQRTQFELSTELMNNLPPTIQVSVTNGTQSCWMTVGSDNMTISCDDLMLKFGQKIEGFWAVIGILDGLPTESLPSILPLSMPSDPQEQAKLASQLGISQGGMLALGISTFARLHMGRPTGSYGLTPLLIFREVG